MTALTPWSYGGVEVRTITEGADVYFVASDVAAILGYGHTPHMTRSLDEDEKGVRRTDTLGGEQLLTVITEAGLYRAIIQRQAGRVADDNTKASVKAFQRWVTHEVLPSIRRSGSYSVAPAYALPQSYIHPRTGEVVLDPPQVRITIKGLNALHAALGGSAPLDLDHALTALEPVAQ